MKDLVSKWQKIRHRIWELDNYSCVVCGKTQEENLMYHNRTLNIHHLDENYDNTNDDNLVTLCAYCHSQHHKNKWRRKDGH